MGDILDFHLRDLATHQRAFVLRSSSEPQRTSTHVPLKQALEDLGRATFPNAWSGYEQLRFVAPVLPIPIARGFGLLGPHVDEDTEFARWTKQPDTAALNYAERLLLELTPDEAPRRNSLAALIVDGRPPPIFSTRQWQKAMELATQRHALLHQDWRRLLRICDDFKHFCVEKKLKTYLRPVGGGKFDDGLPWWAWNGEAIGQRFITYRMNPSDPFTQQSQQNASHWIFADRLELDAIVADLGGEKKPTAAQLDDLYLSPYMRCALDTIRALKVTQDNMPKKEPLMAFLAEHWHGECELSQKMKECIAKVIRDEDSRAGRASEHQKRRQAGKVGR